MHRILRAAVAGSAAALVLAAAACGDRDADDVAARTAPGTVDSPAAGMATAPALRVTDVTLGRAMRGDTAVVEDMDDFAVNDTIHAVVRHEGAAPSATITARWTFQDGQVVDERTETVTGTGDRAAYTHFMVMKPTAWPAGNYKLTILVNGQEVESEDFEIGS